MSTRPKISLPAGKAGSSTPKKARPPVRGSGSAPRDRRPRPPAEAPDMPAQAAPAAPSPAARPAKAASGSRDARRERPAPEGRRPRPPGEMPPAQREGRRTGPRDTEDRPRRGDAARPAPRRDAPAGDRAWAQEPGRRGAPPRDAAPARPARPQAPDANRRAGPRGEPARPRSFEDGRPPRRDSAPFERGRAPAPGPRGMPPRDSAAPRADRAHPAPERAPRRFGPDAPPLSTPAVAAPDAAAEGMRLSKRMSELGLASRREADEWIEQGWVRVDGKVVSELGSRVLPGQEITIDPQARQQQAQRVTVLIHKPIGYVSGQAEDGYEPAVVLVKPENQWGGDTSRLRLAPGHLRHLAPAGRLDIDSTGLLVLTQDGRIARRLIGQDSEIEKEYLVRVRWAQATGAPSGPLSQTFPAERLELLRHGLSLDGEALRPARVSWQNEEQLRFVLREGKKRQIRRMCELVGLEVTGLKRIRMGRIVLGNLPPGQWRFLRGDEQF